MEEEPAINQYCSRYCEHLGIACIGTGRKPEPDNYEFGGFFLVEDGSYWEAKIEQQQGILGRISTILERLGNKHHTSYRLQAITDEKTKSSKDTIRVIFYRYSSHSGLTREQYTLSRQDLETQLSSIIENPQGDRQPTDIRRDILICTHAQRDRCCGRFGYPIFKNVTHHSEKGVKVWRSSHIGGHRMAPTMLTFPEGEYWGYITLDLVKKIIQGEPCTNQEIDYHFRGGVNLTPAQQIVDRKGLKRYGDEWRQYPINIAEQISGEYTLITMQRGDLSVSQRIKTEPTMISISETRCGRVKDVSQFVVGEN